MGPGMILARTVAVQRLVAVFFEDKLIKLAHVDDFDTTSGHLQKVQLQESSISIIRTLGHVFVVAEVAENKQIERSFV